MMGLNRRATGAECCMRSLTYIHTYAAIMVQTDDSGGEFVYACASSIGLPLYCAYRYCAYRTICTVHPYADIHTSIHSCVYEYTHTQPGTWAVPPASTGRLPSRTHRAIHDAIAIASHPCTRPYCTDSSIH